MCRALASSGIIQTHTHAPLAVTVLKPAGRHDVVEGAPELFDCAEGDDPLYVFEPVLGIRAATCIASFER